MLVVERSGRAREREKLAHDSEVGLCVWWIALAFELIAPIPSAAHDSNVRRSVGRRRRRGVGIVLSPAAGRFLCSGNRSSVCSDLHYTPFTVPPCVGSSTIPKAFVNIFTMTARFRKLQKDRRPLSSLGGPFLYLPEILAKECPIFFLFNISS